MSRYRNKRQPQWSDYLEPHKETETLAVKVGATGKKKKFDLRRCFHRKVVNPKGETFLRWIQLVLLGVSMLVTGLSVGLCLRNTFLSSGRLSRTSRTFHWGYLLYSSLVLLVLFMSFPAAMTRPVNMSLCSKTGFKLVLIGLIDFFLLSHLTFIDLLVFSGNHRSGYAILLVTFFSPTAAILTRLIIIPAFMCNFDFHLSKGKWTMMCGPCGKCSKALAKLYQRQQEFQGNAAIVTNNKAVPNRGDTMAVVQKCTIKWTGARHIGLTKPGPNEPVR